MINLAHVKYSKRFDISFKCQSIPISLSGGKHRNIIFKKYFIYCFKDEPVWYIPRTNIELYDYIVWKND